MLQNEKVSLKGKEWGYFLLSTFGFEAMLFLANMANMGANASARATQILMREKAKVSCCAVVNLARAIAPLRPFSIA